MKTIITFFTIVLPFLLSAQTQTFDLSTDKIMNENYPFAVVQSAQSYTNKVGDYIFYSESEFIDFCNATFGLDSKIPFIDFNTETAVVAFKSFSNTTAKLFADNVVETEHYIKVNVKTTNDQKGVSKKRATNQYIIVKVKKSNKEIKVIHVK